MSLIEKLKLAYRAFKYQYRDDAGGIGFLLDNIQSGDTVLDIGAHKGGYLYHIRQQAGDKGKVIAFEPQTALFNYLQTVIKVFAWQNVAVYQTALSDKTGEASLYLPDNKKQSASSPGATIAQLQSQQTYSATETVATDTLDNFCKVNDLKPALLKIDVEGNELPLLKGGINILSNYHPKLLVEVEARHVGKDKAQETLSFLAQLGYNIFFIHGKALKPITEFSFDVHQNITDKKNYCNNFAFLPATSK